MRKLKKITRQHVRLWLLVVVIGSGVTLFAYIAVQQSLREGLNAPQLQIADDTAAQLNNGALPSAVISPMKVDESTSLAPFTTIVDQHMHVLASSGSIGTIVPLPPASAFSDAQSRPSNWFTWQHDNNTLRDATVIVPFHHEGLSGYVLVARSMAQVEATIGHITVLAALTLLGVILAPAIILLLV
jgi:hypothetical protein